ncbi:MAG: aminopeptidase P family N-terminal domain-containing protein, partial [Saprospiraceae bacterium]
MDQKLKALRKVMNENKVDAMIIPSSDPHQSEYVADHWQERAWISGFTGSAGWVVVTQDHAGLWTDSRYFLQGEMQIKGSEFVLHKMHQQFGLAYIDYLMGVLPAESTVCINGFMFGKAAVDGMVKSFAPKHIQVVHR